MSFSVRELDLIIDISGHNDRLARLFTKRKNDLATEFSPQPQTQFERLIESINHKIWGYDDTTVWMITIL